MGAYTHAYSCEKGKVKKIQGYPAKGEKEEEGNEQDVVDENLINSEDGNVKTAS